MEKQFVAFEAAGNRYCIEIMDVQEVCRENTITYMPNFPDFVEGVINLRGRITPIISIHKKIYSQKWPVEKQDRDDFFDLPKVGLSLESESPHVKNADNKYQQVKTSSYKLIIVKIGSVLVGLLVDNLDKILTANDSDIQNAEAMGHINQAVISGILHVGEEIYVVLNTKGILDSEEEQALHAQLNGD